MREGTEVALGFSTLLLTASILRSLLKGSSAEGFSFSPLTSESLRLTADDDGPGEFTFLDRRTRDGVKGSAFVAVRGLLLIFLMFLLLHQNAAGVELYCFDCRPPKHMGKLAAALGGREREQ